VRHFARARIVRNVSPGSFFPPPDVTSSIVRLDVRPEAVPRPELFALIRDGFRHRRKTLAKNLQMAGYERAAVEGALEEEGLDVRIRGEALGLDEFVVLSSRLQSGT
jgi:16S rRNA (adenine1518-N6/adenine1519-N6)-dimethyltransferase